MAWFAGTVVVLAAVGTALHYSIGSDDSVRATVSTSTRTLDLGAQNGRIAYGANPKDVLTTLGSPTSRHAGCWLYKAKAHTINGEYLGDVVDGLRYCFGTGPVGGKVVTAISEHVVAHRLPNKQWYPGGWGMMILLETPKTLPN